MAFQEPNLTRNLSLQDLMVQIGARHGRSAGEVALAWVLRNPAVTAAIVGMRSAEQAKGVLGALEFRLNPEEVQEIDNFRQNAASASH
ncbi:MAG TPA: aldo/keto reductase [Bryobacteraceae bacterium]|nr:aldo/keto reductase [Bryobacteraceae bacterium]